MKLHEKTEAAEQLIPREGYLSRAWYEREQAELFGRYWNFAGMTDDLPNPGEYQVVQAGRGSLFVVRGEDGELRAFQNLCRHRGTQMLEGKGCAERVLRCPYHYWSYALDGTLRSVPRQGLFPSLDKAQLGLLPASLGVFRGLIFVHPDPEPEEDFASFVDGMEGVIGPHHPLELVEVSRTRYEFESNWKLVVENYIDAYHLFYLHEKAAATFDHERFEWDACGRHYLFYEPVVERYKDWAQRVYGDPRPFTIPGTDPETFGGHFHMLFPNIGWVGTAFWWSTFHAIPVAPDRTIVESRVRLTPDGAKRAAQGGRRARRRIETERGERLVTLDDYEGNPLESNDLMLEDMWACRQMQLGITNPAYRVGPMAREFESTLTFHQKNVLDFVSPR